MRAAQKLAIASTGLHLLEESYTERRKGLILSSHHGAAPPCSRVRQVMVNVVLLNTPFKVVAVDHLTRACVVPAGGNQL
jgi:hypothetical protein